MISILILFFTPRIFAESFYNSRDIFFLSLFIFNLCAAQNFLSKQNFITSTYFSLSAALLIYAKVVGLLAPILFLLVYYLNSLNQNKKNINEIKFILYIIFTTIFFIYIFWPYLWTDPIKNFLYSFKWMIESHNDLTVINYYFGEYITSTSTPWHYRIVWFLITTPVMVLFFFAIGFFLIFVKIIKGFLTIDKMRTDPWKNTDEMFNFYLFLVLIMAVFASIKFNPSQFGGWRHLYFLYPIVVLFSLIGLRFIISYLKKVKFNYIILIMIAINFSYIFYWNYTYHPHQQVFFNYISKNYAKNNFDLDYWGLSNLHSIKYILKNNKNYPIKLATISFSSLKESTLMLDENTKKKLLIVYDYDDADFLISNHMKKLRKNFTVDRKKYEKYYEIIVNDISINTVYKKIN